MIHLSYVPTYDELNDYYGNPELEPGVPDPDFIRNHCVLLRLPFPLRISWGDRREIRRVWIHKLVAQAYAEALEEVENYRGTDYLRRHGYDVWGGIYSYRPLRGGSKLSTHSWAISADHNPHIAPYKGASEQPAFIVSAFIKRGFVSFEFDEMHYQSCVSFNRQAILDREVIMEINGWDKWPKE